MGVNTAFKKTHGGDNEKINTPYRDEDGRYYMWLMLKKPDEGIILKIYPDEIYAYRRNRKQNTISFMTPDSYQGDIETPSITVYVTTEVLNFINTHKPPTLTEYEVTKILKDTANQCPRRGAKEQGAWGQGAQCTFPYCITAGLNVCQETFAP